MMELVRSWLLGLIMVSLLCAAAGALMPRGPVRQVGRLVCGLVMLAAILSPAVKLDAAGGQRWLADYFASVERRRTELENEVNDQMKTIIEGEYAAYIVDKAAELGLTGAVRVECGRSEEGLYLPIRTEVSGPLTGPDQARLAEIIARDLGVPREAQVFRETKEEMP